MSSVINVLPTFAGLKTVCGPHVETINIHLYTHLIAVLCVEDAETHNTHENYHVNIIGHVCDLRVSSYGCRDNIKIHEERGGNSSITPWTLVAGAVPALNSCLLYTHVQAG